MPDKSLAGAHRAQLHLRPLPHPFAAALRHLPRLGTAVRQVVELGRAGPQRQCRLSGLHGRRAETRRRHRRRSAAAGAAFRGAALVRARCGGTGRCGLPAFDLDLLRLGAQPHQPLRRAGKQGPARKGAARGRNLPRLCRHRDQQRLPDDAPFVRPGDGSGDSHAPARNGDRHASAGLYRNRAGAGHGPAGRAESGRGRRTRTAAFRRLRRSRAAPDAFGAQHHGGLDLDQVQPLHDRRPARRNGRGRTFLRIAGHALRSRRESRERPPY